MSKFSSKRFDKFISRNIDKITEGYIAHGGRADRRSKTGISKASKKRAAGAFERSLRGIMEKNPELTQSEASTVVMRSNKFNIYSDIAKQNWRKTLKEAGINVQLRSLNFVKTQNGSPVYQITRGKNAGKYTFVKHFPGQSPSFQIVLIDSI